MNLPRKYIAILIISFGFCISYGWSYIYLRQNKVIVHYYISCCGHSVENRIPDGPLMFAAAWGSRKSFDELLQKQIRRNELINTVYFPLRKLEEFYWGI